MAEKLNPPSGHGMVPKTENRKLLSWKRKLYIAGAPEDEADIFWARLDAGERYLRIRFAFDQNTAKKLRDSKAFWDWFNFCWDMNDMRLFNRLIPELSPAARDMLDWDWYIREQDALMTGWTPNRALLEHVFGRKKEEANRGRLLNAWTIWSKD